MIPLNYEGWSRANINFQIMLCHSPIMLFSFLGNLFMQFRILLFPFEFCYSFFRFYYAIMNSLIQFPILLFAFELCYAVFQCYYSIVQSSHVVSNSVGYHSNSIMPLWILLFTLIQFPILLFPFEISSSKSGTSFIWPTVPWGPVTTWLPEYKERGGLGRRRFTESITSMHKCNSTAT